MRQLMQGSAETISPSAVLVLQGKRLPHQAVLTAQFF